MAQQEGAGRRNEADPRFSAPQISLPKGGGAIRGIGEKFAANPVTGTGSLTVPIATPPGRSSFGPQLSLSYDSGAGNGPFGFGWNLSLPSITRKTDKGLPEYRDAAESDVFILSGTEDLVPVLEEVDGDWVRSDPASRMLGEVEYRVHAYRPRTEGLFARIERWTAVGTGETHWRSITRDNVTTLYGWDSGSRIFDPAAPARVFSWLICVSYDDRGNAIVYEYKEEDSQGADVTQAHEKNRAAGSRSANRYLKRIRYGNRISRLAQPDLPPEQWMFEVVFDYGEHHPAVPTPDDHGAWLCRRDPFSSYRAGFEVRTYRLCQRVLVFHHFPGEEGVGARCLVRSTDFAYRDISDAPADRGRGDPMASFIASVTQSGYRRQRGGYRKRSLPPLEFTYSAAELQHEVREVDAASLENLPAGVDGSTYQWVDLDGEGVSGILTEQASAWYYKPNLGEGRLGPLEVVGMRPSLARLEGGGQLLDLAGDGRLDLVDFGGPTPGFYERTPNRGWESFTPFASAPKLFWGDPNLKFVDLDGDSHADVLLAEGDAFTWYPSRAEEGFGPGLCVRVPVDEESGPRLVFADGMQSVYLADMSGDGLTDLVRIRNGEVCYWPNLGHGRFGGRVTMEASPWFDAPDQFEQRRIRVVDIDGSGNTDIIYLGRDGVRLYFNQAGNRWSEPRRLPFPRVDDVSSVAAVDLMGSGTACLVWSSPLPGDAGRPLRYVELMGEKPHLLVGVRNNLGAETRVRYAPSTRFYLADRAAGRPWVTRLPFPVHVVERVETYDHVGRSRFVTRYAYHHGYFDGHEREFRGFGQVEQWDTEELAALAADGDFPAVGNLDAASHVPPVCTRTWYHTGAWLEGGHIEERFADEYYREGALPLPDTELPAGLLLPAVPPGAGGRRVARPLSAGEARQAVRALRGSVLRQEVYGLDGSEAEGRPYRVSERAYAVEMLQPQGDNRHAVFLAHPRETLDFHFERKLYGVGRGRYSDPRVSHELVLEVDEFGDVLRSASVAYGRRRADPELSRADQDEQARTVVVFTESAYTAAVEEPDTHRAPLPCETRSYELHFARPAPGVPFRPDELRAVLDAAGDGRHDLTYGDFAGACAADGVPWRRLVEHARTLYRRDDLTAPLPLGRAGARGLLWENYRLAITPELLAEVFRRPGAGGEEDLLPDPAAALGGEGGYVAGDAMRALGRFPAGDPAGRWWIPSGQVRYSPGAGDGPGREQAHALAHFFLPHRFLDPWGNETWVAYDGYDLLVLDVRDPTGNHATAGVRDESGRVTENGNDYRVLQPARVMDANRNRSAAAFDALGLLVGTAVMGKPGEDLGDSLDGFDPDPPEPELLAFLVDPLGGPPEDPEAPARALLQGATTRLLYDLGACVRTRGGAHPQPAAVCTLAREVHGREERAASSPTRVQIGFSYSDGFGREIQKKARAEPGPLPGGGVAAPRWVGSGWKILNNKGKPVREHEPFFTATPGFEFARTAGAARVLFYDPVERVVATLRPDHAWEKVVFDPWRQESWDVNDTVLVADPANDPDVGGFFRRLPDAEYLPTWHAERRDGTLGAEERDAAAKAAVHAWTPTAAHFDALGRTFLTVARNRLERNGVVAPDEEIETRVQLDVEGNPRAVVDALGRVAVRYDYDLLGTRIRQDAMDARARWTLSDAAGKPIRAWDSRGHTVRTAYDALRRPTDVWVAEGGVERLAEHTDYGEVAGAEALNLRGRVVRVLDGAGVAATEAYDFKGNPLRATRRLLDDPREQPDWSRSMGLEGETFTTSSRYDALDRVVQVVAPHGARAADRLSVVQPAYNEAGLLERLDAWLDHPAEPPGLLDPATATLHAVTDVAYDARGQRTEIGYGNRVHTQYTYDPRTFRLVHLVTTRQALRDDPDAPREVQDLRYTYDPAGNVTHIRDDAQHTVFFAGRRVEPGTDYRYDALYRLIEAAGREHLGQAPGGGARSPVPPGDGDAPRMGLRHPGDGAAMGRYLQEYGYDRVGNVRALRHRGTDPSHPGWKRCYRYAADGNRLLATGGPRDAADSDGDCGPVLPERYAYDPHGNTTAMPHLPLMWWDFRDRLRATSRQAAAEGVPREVTWYAYDASGQRVRKATYRAGVRVRERIYLGGFEIYREYGGADDEPALERETLHLMDGERRVALVETRTRGRDDSLPRLVRYQHGNHLGSACLELDDEARVVTYEEYYPYGSTSYQAVRSALETPKRYRYTGMERDEESGLGYHTARYYAPWLGRWVSADPAGIEGGLNLFEYGNDNPIAWMDTNGKDPHPGLTMLRRPREGEAWRQEIAARRAMERLQAERQRDTASDGFPTSRAELERRISEAPGLSQRDRDSLRQDWERERMQRYGPALPFSEELAPRMQALGERLREYVFVEIPQQFLFAIAVELGAPLAIEAFRRLGVSPATARLIAEDARLEARYGSVASQAERAAGSGAMASAARAGTEAATGAADASAAVAATVRSPGQVLMMLRDEATSLTRGITAGAATPAQFGSINDAVFKTLVENAVQEGRLPSTIRISPPGLTNPGSAGIDVWDTATGFGWDLTTATVRQVAGHDARYLNQFTPDGTFITEVIPLVYSR